MNLKLKRSQFTVKKGSKPKRTVKKESKPKRTVKKESKPKRTVKKESKPKRAVKKRSSKTRINYKRLSNKKRSCVKNKVAFVMKEFKNKSLKSSTGYIIKNPKQGIAIALSIAKKECL
jgi:hypothetical protein